MKKHILTLFVGLSIAAQAQIIPLPPPPEPTPAEMAASKITADINRGLKDRVSQLVLSWEALWENPSASPAEILQALGTNAVLVLTAGQLAVADITSIGAAIGKTPEELVGNAKYLTVGQPITVHPDGRITLVEGP